MSEVCRNCKYVSIGEESTFGACRRFPPTVVRTQETDDGAEIPVCYWPVISDTGYCGEFARVPAPKGQKKGKKNKGRR